MNVDRKFSLPEHAICTLCNAELPDDYDIDVVGSTELEEFFLILRCDECASKTAITDGGTV